MTDYVVKITRTQIVVVGEVGTNDFGDLTFTDKSGGQYKVGAKRKQYFEKTIIPGMAVQLNYAVFKGKEYIYSATQVKDGLPPASKETTPSSATQVKADPPKLWEDKIRSMSLSYAKDIVLADKWELQSIGYLAAQFEKYLNHTLTAAELDTKIREKSTLKTE